MITCSDEGKIIVNVDGNRYDLSVSEQYAEFLLWLTTPEEEMVIGSDTFEVSLDVPEDQAAKAKRYSTFLSEFAQRRKEKLAAQDQDTPAEQRDSDIEAFIARLKDATARDGQARA